MRTFRFFLEDLLSFLNYQPRHRMATDSDIYHKRERVAALIARVIPYSEQYAGDRENMSYLPSTAITRFLCLVAQLD